MKPLFTLAALMLTALASAGQAATITGLFNTGEGFNSGDVDTHYTFAIDIAGGGGTASGTNSHGVVTSGFGFPFDYYWMPNDSTSRWLAPSADQGRTYDLTQDGHYVWTLNFDLSGFDPASASFSGRFAADNGGEIWLNSEKIADNGALYPFGWESWTPFSASSGFVTGVNTLKFFVTNQAQAYGNPTGLRVEFLSSSVDPLTATSLPGPHVPVPPALVMFVSALPVLLFRRRAKPA